MSSSPSSQHIFALTFEVWKMPPVSLLLSFLTPLCSKTTKSIMMHVNFLRYSCKLLFTKKDCTPKSTIPFLLYSWQNIGTLSICITYHRITQLLFTFLFSYYKDTPSLFITVSSNFTSSKLIVILPFYLYRNYLPL